MSRILNRNTATRLISNYKSSISIPSARTASRSCSNPPSCLLFTSFSPRLFSTSRSIASATSSSPASSGPSSTTQTQKQTQNQGETPETGPIARYSHLVETGLLRDDEFQRSIIHKLQKLHDDLKGYQQKLPSKEEAKVKVKGGLFSRFFGQSKSEEDENPLTISPDIPKGLYLFGDVGTGKSMLMDLFYETLPPKIKRKKRIHFHQFMIDAHKRMHQVKSESHRPSGIVMGATNVVMGALGNTTKATENSGGGPAGGGKERKSLTAAQEEADPTAPVARMFAEEYEVLCFDEFQVTDIADAMILRKLMEHMLAYGVVMVMTSNRQPDDLYKNGIQRSSFLPCIDLLKEQLLVTDLDSGTDYRKLPRALSKVYFSPLDHSNLSEFDKLFEGFTSDPKDPVQTNRELKIWGRVLKVPQSNSKIARFTFNQLCGSPKSAADYIEICNQFGTIFIDEIPKMGLHQRDLARRFITFIDAAYESKVKILTTSEVPILQIFAGGEEEKGPTKDQMRSLMDDLGLTMNDLGGSPIFTGEEELFAFARVISRLTEMGTAQYASSTKTGVEESVW